MPEVTGLIPTRNHPDLCRRLNGGVVTRRQHELPVAGDIDDLDVGPGVGDSSSDFPKLAGAVFEGDLHDFCVGAHLDSGGGQGIPCRVGVVDQDVHLSGPGRAGNTVDVDAGTSQCVAHVGQGARAVFQCDCQIACHKCSFLTIETYADPPVYGLLMATWDDIRRITLDLPETSERTNEGVLQWRVKEKPLIWERPLRRADYEALDEAAPEGPIVAVWVDDVGVKEALLFDDPDVFFTTPHFDGYAIVLIRLEEIQVPELEELIIEAWLDRAPKRVVAEYLKASE